MTEDAAPPAAHGPCLPGRVALVFGGGTQGDGWGNGRASAVAYAREGARVAVIDVDPAAAGETVDVVAEEGGEALAFVADVTDASAVQAAVSHCLAKFGRVDILHNNVGIVRNGGPVEQSEADWDRVMAVNVKSMFLTSKHVLPVMQRQGCGVITNISSLASLRFAGTPWISYSASKGAVNQFTQAVAMQYAKRGIRANAIVPGLINTPMTIEPHLGSYADLDDMLARRHARCPTGSMGDAWDVAHAAVFLASDKARYITGAILPVDGGISCVVP